MAWIGKGVWPPPIEALVLVLVLATGEGDLGAWGRAADVVQRNVWWPFPGGYLLINTCRRYSRRDGANQEQRTPMARLFFGMLAHLRS